MLLIAMQMLILGWVAVLVAIDRPGRSDCSRSRLDGVHHTSCDGLGLQSVLSVTWSVDTRYVLLATTSTSMATATATGEAQSGIEGGGRTSQTACLCP